MVFWKPKLYDKLNRFNRLDQLKINLRNQLYLAKLDFKKKYDSPRKGRVFIATELVKLILIFLLLYWLRKK